MSIRVKNILYSLVLIGSVFAVYLYRKNAAEPVRIEGQTMGTTYHVTYFDSEKRDFKPSIDSLLQAVNQSINTYLPSAEVTRFNTTSQAVAFEDVYLREILETAQVVVKESNGAFDPTVMPLVNLWGFGPAEPLNPDNLAVDSIREFVGFEKVRFTTDSLWKSDPRVQLDFGGIGQGYGADVIVRFLKARGITHMLVEIGGEGVACGTNQQRGKPWEIGILDPNSTEQNQFFKAYVSVADRAFTTSGNYFNYREIDGKKYSHTIDPFTGYPTRQAILSATVFAENCAFADAWATAFMVMGHEKAIATAATHPELDVLLMYTQADGSLQMFISDRIKNQVTVNP